MQACMAAWGHITTFKDVIVIVHVIVIEPRFDHDHDHVNDHGFDSYYGVIQLH